MAETLQTLSVISFACSIICLILAIFFWFFFKIPTVIGDLSGQTARKSIAKIRETNEKSGKKRSIQYNRVDITSPIVETEKQSRCEQSQRNERVETGLLEENKLEYFDSQATDLLGDESEDVTTELTLEVDDAIRRTRNKKLEMIEEVILIHTDEIIS